MRGWQCTRNLWLYNYRKDLLPEGCSAQQQIFVQGQELGRLAWECFPDGVLIEADHLHIGDALTATTKALSGKTKSIYEATFSYNGVIARADIIAAATGGKWDLMEVKSSTSVAEQHLQDIALQRYVLEGAGIKLRRVYVMLINTAYVRHGDINPAQLFIREDITRETADLQDDIRTNLAAFKKLLGKRTEPAIDIGPQCSSPYPCDFIPYCWKHVPECPVFDLPRINKNKLALLMDKGILDIKKIPADFPLSKNQSRAVSVIKSGKPVIDTAAIEADLKDLVYPLYFLDFESINPPVPPYDGLRPYQQLVFQASLHVQQKPKARIEHYEYLGDGKTDPRPGMVEFLISRMGRKGSIIVFNKSFEMTRIKELAKDFPKQSKQLLPLNDRIWDLALPFQQGHYVHPGFACSYSIKKVLPALVPGMSYENLEVTNGGDAQNAYLSLMQCNLPIKERKRIRKALKIYCGQDTLAMVRILAVLNKI
jgi:hypothetical protein